MVGSDIKISEVDGRRIGQIFVSDFSMKDYLEVSSSSAKVENRWISEWGLKALKVDKMESYLLPSEDKFEFLFVDGMPMTISIDLFLSWCDESKNGHDFDRDGKGKKPVFLPLWIRREYIERLGKLLSDEALMVDERDDSDADGVLLVERYLMEKSHDQAEVFYSDAGKESICGVRIFFFMGWSDDDGWPAVDESANKHVRPPVNIFDRNFGKVVKG